MPRFQIMGIGADSGRKRSRVYNASNAAEAKKVAGTDGILQQDIIELPPADTAGELVNTAAEYEIPVPDGISDLELSDLICLHTWRDRSACERFRNLASEYGVLVTQYAGQGLLCQKIFNRLRESNDEHGLATWFAYRVYLDLTSNVTESEVAEPNDPLIRVAARLLVASTSFIKSLDTQYYGADLMCFGEWTDSAGIKRQAGNRTTLAYQQAKELLLPFTVNQQDDVKVKLLKHYRQRVAPALFAVAKTLISALEILPRNPESINNQKKMPAVTISHEVIYGCVFFTCIIIGLLSLND